CGSNTPSGSTGSSTPPSTSSSQSPAPTETSASGGGSSSTQGESSTGGGESSTPGGGSSTEPAGPGMTGDKSAVKIGLAYDLGGRGDQSFNDSAARGLDKAVAEGVVKVGELTAQANEPD